MLAPPDEYAGCSEALRLTRLERVLQLSVHHVRREKAALFQWVQGPPGDRSSRKQPELFAEVGDGMKG